jgi:membrane-associated phospholipid phosphatase
VAALSPGTYTHVHTLEALRSGAMSVVRLDDLEGLITFPSFHTANAILFAWALWSVHYLRLPVLALNVLMVASTPTAGSHYFIDILGGTAVALLAIVAAFVQTRVFGVQKRVRDRPGKLCGQAVTSPRLNASCNRSRRRP